MRLHFGAVLSGNVLLPDCGVVQDDERIPLPHWATPEGLEKVRARTEEERQVAELRQGLFRAGRFEELYCWPVSWKRVNKT